MVEVLLRTEDRRGMLICYDTLSDLLGSSYHEGALELSIRWSYTSVLDLVGLKTYALDARAKAAVNKDDMSGSNRLRPLFHLACERVLPDSEMVRVLVEELHVDVNAIDDTGSYGASSSTTLQGSTGKNYWWTAKGIECLVKGGTNMDIQDLSGDIPLRIAVERKARSCIETLPRHDANTNTLGNDGLSCLSMAGSPEVDRPRLNHGASATAGKEPLIFDATGYIDHHTVRLLVHTPHNYHIPLRLDREGRKRSLTSRPSHDEETYIKYPALFAASSRHNTKARRRRMIPIIGCSIGGGADPYLPSKKSDTVLHRLYGCSDTIETFPDLSSLNLETRDSPGRPLSLAAFCRCKGSHGYAENVADFNSLPTAASLLLSKGEHIDALDSMMRNDLHCILSGSSRAKMGRRDYDMIMASSSIINLVKQADNKGEAPLLCAVNNQHPWAIDSLLHKGYEPGSYGP